MANQALENILPSLGQERLWFLHELNPQATSYNI